MTQVLDLFSQFYRPMRLCSFSSAIYFLLMFRAGNFYCSFSSLIIFLVLSILLVSQSTALFLKIIYCIFQLHNFHLLLLYIFWFFVEIFSLSSVFFFFFKSVLIIACLSIFIRAIPAYSSDNSNISVIL